MNSYDPKALFTEYRVMANMLLTPLRIHHTKQKSLLTGISILVKTLTKFFSTLTLFTVLYSNSSAKQLPLFELGIGPGAVYQNYYTGTKDKRFFPIPAIIPIYRGEIFKSDDEGVRALLLDNDRLKLDLSADFNLAINSDDVDLRDGMPDIDHVFQIGPSLKISLYKSATSNWLLRLPLRATFTFNKHISTSGYTFSPDLTYLLELTINETPWRLGLSFGPKFGTSSYHDIFYQVKEEFVTADREVFKTSGGFSGYKLVSTLTSKTKRRIASFFVRSNSLSGSDLEKSSLVETNSDITVGFIYSILFFKSKTMVNR